MWYILLGFYGKNNLENTQCDIILETNNDLSEEMKKKYMFEKDEVKKASKNSLLCM